MYSLWQDLSVHTKKTDLMTLTFDLLWKKLNLDNNFWTKSDWALILHISIPCDKTSLMIPIFFTLWPWPWLWPTYRKTWIGCRGGISPVRTDPDLVFSLRKKFFRSQAQRAGNGQILEARKKLHRPELLFAKALAVWKFWYDLFARDVFYSCTHFLSLIKKISVSAPACLLWKKGILVCFLQYF